jgi:N-acetylglucosamine-6-sulfatase
MARSDRLTTSVAALTESMMPSACDQNTRRAAIALAATAVALALGAVAAAEDGAGSRGGAAKPNFLVIVTDDQTLEQMRALPKTERLVGRKGTVFTEAAVTTPQCCPSRVSYLTGQYAHNTGVLSNKHGYVALADPGNVLPVWLQRAGYTTAHLGKFLNGYEKAIGPITEVAPGWDEWATLLKPRRYLDYELQVNGESVPYGDDEDDYLTRVLTARAKRLIRELGAAQDPFYIQLDHYAPHSGFGDPSGSCGDFAGAESPGFERYGDKPLPESASFNEREIADKPVFLRRHDRLGKANKRRIRNSYRCALAALDSVDQGVKELVGTLEEEGLLEDTVLVFTSDNGFYYGEHRIPGSKTLPYEEAIHVPLLIRLPDSLRGETRVREVDEQVANIDLAPTILELAGARPCGSDGCRVLDGRSLVSLLQGRGGFPGGRAVAIELTQGKDTVKPTLSCSYQGLRTPRELYVEHTSVPRPSDRSCEPTLEVEHYDLRADPFQLENLGEDAALAARVAALQACTGIAGAPGGGPGPHCE